MTDKTVTSEDETRLQVSDGFVSLGQTFYRYDSYSMGKIVAMVYDGHRLWDSPWIRTHSALTPEKAAQIGRQNARTPNGRAKVDAALRRFNGRE